ncbi:MAG: helix-turn-helix transcriptional regulator [Actinobacteria bacterium]|nr:helix-turn-helix transcriptional regulator [Actinomycetota bacterium]
MTPRSDRRPAAEDGKSAAAGRFGENLRALRARDRISQEELASRADVHRTQIGVIERGSRLPRLDTLLKLAAGLDVELSDLLAGITYRCSAYAPASGEFEITPRTRPKRGAS